MSHYYLFYFNILYYNLVLIGLMFFLIKFWASLNDFKVVLWTYQALNFDWVTHNLRYCHRRKSIISTCNHKHNKGFRRFEKPLVLTGHILAFIIFISSKVSQQKTFYHFYFFVFHFIPSNYVKFFRG